MRRLLAYSLLALALLPGMAAAAEPVAPRLIVTGEGEAAARPDVALLSLSVLREAQTARAALDANNSAMAAVIEAMKAAGIEPRDLQTAGIQINPRYEYSNRTDGSQEARLVGYQVVNTLTVRLRDIARTGEILDQAVSLGINQGGGISFTSSDPGAALTEARKRAVADALSKAKTLAEAAGVELGRIVEISDVAATQPPLPYQAKGIEMRDAAAAAVPVEAGENAYTVQVNLTFELE